MKRIFSFKETLRFMVGGFSAVITDFLIYHLLMNMGVSVNFSKAISYIMGAIVGFIINKFWTFESKHFLPKEVIKYIVLYAVSALINASVNRWALGLTGKKTWAFLIATGVSTVINFLGQKFIVFSKKGES